MILVGSIILLCVGFFFLGSTCGGRAVIRAARSGKFTIPGLVQQSLVQEHVLTQVRNRLEGLNPLDVWDLIGHQARVDQLLIARMMLENIRPEEWAALEAEGMILRLEDEPAETRGPTLRMSRDLDLS